MGRVEVVRGFPVPDMASLFCNPGPLPRYAVVDQKKKTQVSFLALS
jgi:hypothetical protein